jgi:hypothetical protein
MAACVRRGRGDHRRAGKDVGAGSAMLVKIYGQSSESEKRYSPAECIGAVKYRVEGNPDPKHVSTSFAEQQNLNVRMHTRRLLG